MPAHDIALGRALERGAHLSRHTALHPVAEPLDGNAEGAGHARGSAVVADGLIQGAHGADYTPCLKQSQQGVEHAGTHNVYAVEMAKPSEDPSSPIAIALQWAEAAGWNQVVLAAKLDVSPADITNWKARGLPPTRYQSIAALFGRTVDDLLRGASIATTTNDWVADRPLTARTLRLLTELTTTEARVLQAFRQLPDEVREEYVAGIERAANEWSSGTIAKVVNDAMQDHQAAVRLNKNKVDHAHPKTNRRGGSAAGRRKSNANRS